MPRASNDAPAPVDNLMDWDDIVAPMIDAAEKHMPWLLDLLQSEALCNACYGAHVTVYEIQERIAKIWLCLFWIRNRQADGTPDVRALAESVESSRTKFQAEIDSVIATAAAARAPYQQRLMAMASEMSKELLAQPRLGKRGGAGKHNSEGAWAGWCIREIDALLSPEASNRFATVSALLAFAGIERDKVAVRAILKAGQ